MFLKIRETKRLLRSAVKYGVEVDFARRTQFSLHGGFKANNITAEKEVRIVWFFPLLAVDSRDLKGEIASV